MKVDNVTLEDPEVLSALSRLFAWDGLAKSDRLRGILRYLFDEACAGRGADVKAKTIGMDVYGYSADDLTERESVVRVDVGRLRRKIEVFYKGVGQNEPLRFVLPKGAYSLSIDRIAQSSTPNTHTWRSLKSTASLSVIGIGIAIASLFAFLGYSLSQRNSVQKTASDLQSLERSVIFDASPARLRAINLAEVGRDLIFPALSPGQLEAAKVTFDAAIGADSSYFGGYAVRSTGACDAGHSFAGC